MFAEAKNIAPELPRLIEEMKRYIRYALHQVIHRLAERASRDGDVAIPAYELDQSHRQPNDDLARRLIHRMRRRTES